MAVNTPKTLRNKVMYQVFVRNFSEEGTFDKVREKLDEIQALGAEIKRDPLFTDSVYKVWAQEEKFLVATHEKNGKKALGVFSVKADTGYVEVDFPDGFYTNLIDSKTVEVFRGGIQNRGVPIILIT